MKKTGAFITRHRRLLMISLLTVTLLASSAANHRRLEGEAIVTSLPVTSVQTASGESIAVFVADRDVLHQQEVAALSALIDRADIDSRTREEAAAQLTMLVQNRQAREALEDALSGTALAPCAAVVAGGAVTIVTANPSPTQEDAALVMVLAAAHAGAQPQDVRILPAE